MITTLEMHPSNESAMALYKNHGFAQIPGSKGIARHFFRGDNRIPARIRLQVGGADAVRLERRDEAAGPGAVAVPAAVAAAPSS